MTGHLVTQLSLLSSIRFRLDRDISTGLITGYYSLNGTTWLLLGSQNIALANPRLGIWVGGSPVPWTNGLPVCSLQTLEVVSTNTTLPVLSYQLVNPPAGASINANGIITWVPDEAQGPGTNVITTIVTDAAQLKATNSFNVVVNEVNTAPTLPAQADRVTVGQASIVITNTAVDADLPANPLTYVLQSGASGATIDAEGVIRWTPTPAQVPSTNSFVTIVTDTNGWALTAQRLSATNSFTVFAYDQPPANGLTLPAQTNRTVNELSTLFVTNTALSGFYASQILSNSYVFNYSSRSALLSAGWSFVATLPDGTPRNTEITNTSAGAVASYNQTTHPGTLWIPCDLGDLWTGANNTRNSLFRPLPAGWFRAQVSLSFAPSLSVQQAHLVLYQDDDNWVAAGLAYNGNIVAALDQETAGSATTLNTAPVSGTNVQLRLDKNPLSGETTALFSSDGLNWTALGQVPQALVNPRLAVWVGGSPYGYTNGMANCILRRVDIVTSNTVPSVLSYQLVNPPALAGIDANGIIAWSPSEAQGPGTNAITTIVNDNGVPPLSATNSFSVVVNEINRAPLLPTLFDQTLTGAATLSVTNTASDLDLPANALSYVLAVAPTNAVISTNGIITWAPTVSQVPSTNQFITVVTDFNPWAVNSQGLSATNSFVVIVPTVPNPNPPNLAMTYNPAANLVHLSFQGPPGALFQVQWAPDATGPWNGLATVRADSSGLVIFEAPGPAQTAFFRVQNL